MLHIKGNSAETWYAQWLRFFKCVDAINNPFQRLSNAKYIAFYKPVSKEHWTKYELPFQSACKLECEDHILADHYWTPVLFRTVFFSYATHNTICHFFKSPDSSTLGRKIVMEALTKKSVIPHQCSRDSRTSLGTQHTATTHLPPVEEGGQ